MKLCLIYNKNSSSRNKSNFIKKICKEIQKKYLIDFFETKTEQEAWETSDYTSCNEHCHICSKDLL